MSTIFVESFETDGNGTRYTTSVAEFSDGSSDFFIRTDGSDISGAYEVTGADGSFFFAAQDIDGEVEDSEQTLSFSGIDIAGFTNLSFSALFAEDDSSDGNEDWDEPDFVTVEFQIDGGGFQDLLAFENDGSQFNSAPLQDTDFDGTGDGTEVTDTFTEFVGAIAATGSTLDLRLTFDLDSGDEDIAVDNIQISDDGVVVGTALSIAPDNAVQAEGDADTTPFTFTVTRSGDTSGATTVDFAVTGSGADPADAADFSGTLPAGTVAFAADETEQTLTIDVTGDTDTEPDEGFTVTLANASGEATIATATAEGTIQDDDAVVVVTSIPEIQGASQVSPFVLGDQSVVEFFDTLPANTFTISGDTVVTVGIVTAVDTNGFYLQDPVGDGDTATSDALFVFTDDAPGVAIGDQLQVMGAVTEFFPGDTDTRNLPTTQISSSAAPVVLSTGNELPAATIIGEGGRIPPNSNIDDDAFAAFQPDVDGIDFFESLEGQLVTAQDLVAVVGTNQFGEIFTVADQGANATGLSDRGTLNIAPDDFNPEKIQIDADPGVSGFDLPEVDAGALLGDVTGVVSYGFGNFEILPTADFTANVIPSDLTPETTAIAGDADTLTVASYNLLNLDPNDADGDTDVADGRFDTIAAQIVDNLNAPDIIGLQEIQDNDGSVNDGVTAADETLQALVDAIAAAGGPTYEFIDNTFIGNNVSGGQPGGNIRTAILYNPDRTDLVDGSVQPIGDQAPGSPFNGSRLPLVATFDFNGEEVVFVDNHFSSKGGSAPILGIEQDFAARQEEVEVNGSLDERQAQSAAVQEFVNEVLTEDPETNVVVLGDLNEFEFVSPVADLETNTGLTNLINDIPEDERYSFIFQGNSQQIDHIFVSGELSEGAEVDVVHVNTEFAATDERASDHDPVVASLNLGGDVAGEAIIGTNRRDELEGTAGDDEIFGLFGRDAISGNGGDDLISGGLGLDVLTGGEGSDTFVFERPLFQAEDFITDFNVDADRLDFSDIFGLFRFGSETPFEEYVQLLQQDVDTLVQIDVRGDFFGPDLFRTFAVLEGVSASTVTAENFITEAA